MFTYDTIQTFNSTEIQIYKFIVSNLGKVPYMTIRELANDLHMSTSTILRFCEKAGCEGYNEFKQKIKTDLKAAEIRPPMSDLTELQHYFTGVNTSAFETKISEASAVVKNCEMVIFVGIGSSGSLAKYGARFFSNLGKFSICLEDNHYPVFEKLSSNCVILVLSESGEGEDLIDMIAAFQQKGYYIMSITNRPDSTLARLSDWNISYNLNQIRVNGGFNATTQVPVLFMLEAISRRM